MRTDIAPQTVRLADYAPPDYWIDSVSFGFRLDPKETHVACRLDVRRSVHADPSRPLVLAGEAIRLISIKVDGVDVDPSRYEVSEKNLVIRDVPASFILEIENTCAPEANTALSGLYMSKGMFCTQCEAEGFRRITYFLDRPDVMARYRVRLEAEKAAYPVLLSNGNPVASGTTDDGRHFAEWEDPHPKPAYLFALVAGDLACVEDIFTTRSGREVTLRVFVQPENKDKCDYTLDALKRSMQWDEESFGREYDLDIFMIVAVDHFNFGAMENKGLNIFNSAYVLASPDTATDMDYQAIESIVAHEYFHNWSGNRVTCRDWFQLCLKEGFTVFRDQEFSADMRSRAVQRIKDVRRLWSGQFPEDAGPLAHPPRPEEYITIDNFYTATVYEKGAEIVRMLKKLLGAETFRKASDLYFSRHDGEAATVEDFVKAMEDASDADLKQFRRWYSDAGTPTLKASYDNGALKLSQETAPTPGQPNKPPRHMPIDYALIGLESGAVVNSGIVELSDDEQSFEIGAADEPVALSLLRGYSAPVRIEQAQGIDERLAILKAESDLFSRWSAADRLWKDICLSFAEAKPMAAQDEILNRFAHALGECLDISAQDPAFTAEVLKSPTDAELAQIAEVVDPSKIAAARRHVRGFVGATLGDRLRQVFDSNQSTEAYSPDAEAAGRRSLKNAAMALLAANGEYSHAVTQTANAENMTDLAAATAVLAGSDAPGREAALARFYGRWQANQIVVNKWLAWCSMRPGEAALDEIKSLLDHPAYDAKTPNKVRAVIGTMAYSNIEVFHRADGKGYDLLLEQLLLIDKLNPQLAARLTTALESWRKLEPGRRGKAKAMLKRLSDKKNLSDNLYEMTTRLLAE